ncbi:MAG TPA: MarC family protein [Terriglobales bacterium]|jgi:multiple antibiotic resistance protein
MHLLVDVIEATLLVVAALFPIVDPLTGALLFLGLTQGALPHERAHLAWRISVDGFLLLLVSMLIGGQVLKFFGVSLPVVQVGGGVVVMAIGWDMLHSNESEPRQMQARRASLASQAFYPLTLPLTVGPGSIAVAIALGANTQRQMYGWAAQWFSALLGPLLIGVSIFVCYRSAERVEKWLGPTGMSVFMRLSAFLILCIGIQICWNGLSALVHIH